MSVKSWLRRAHCWLTLCGLLWCLVSLNAQIGKDHMRVIGYPPVDYDIRIYQRFDKSDYTGAMFHSPFGGLLQGFGTLLDEGVTVFKVQPGDVFNEKNIQAGEFAPLNNDFLDFSQPVFLGFRTPSVNYQSPFPGFPPPAYGWAELTHTEAQLTLDRLGKPIPASEGGLQYTGGLQILDHAMEYGGEGIVVGENQSNSLEGVIPVSRFAELETLAPLEGVNEHWNVEDFDGDGDLDLLLPQMEGGFQVWKQQSDHTFEMFAGGRITVVRGVPDALGDVDGDGDTDVWISREGILRREEPSELWLNNGDGSFVRSDVVLPSSRATVLRDLDADGDPDAVVVTPLTNQGANIENWHNDGAGNFELVSTLTTSCFGAVSAVEDLNGDGFPDVFFSCGASWVGLNQGDGTFKRTERLYSSSNILGPDWGHHLGVGDVDGDGDVDVLVPNINYPSALWLNEGDGDFQLGNFSVGMSKSHAVFGDIDTDGDLDLLVHTIDEFNFGAETPGAHIFWNEGQEHFFKGNTFQGGNRFNAPRLIDIDEDEDLDIMVQYGRSLVVYRNSIEYVDIPSQEGGIQIPDTELKRTILEALGKRAFQTVTNEDMLALKRLDLSLDVRGRNAPLVTDFTGLEKAIHLTSLNLSGGMHFDEQNGIEINLPSIASNDFSFLSSLTQLSVLELRYNGLQALKLPETLQSLQILDASGNELKEFSLPPGLSQLKELRLSSNKITDLTLPANLSMLEMLNVSQNALAVLSIPNGMVELKYLSLGGTGLESIVLPPDLLHLVSIGISRTPIEVLEIPESVGSQAEFSRRVYAYEAPLRSFKASDAWASSVSSSQAFIRADQMKFDENGRPEFPVTGEFGSVVVEKSTNLKDWTAIKRIPVSTPGSKRTFRDSAAHTEGNVFYRVKMRR